MTFCRPAHGCRLAAHRRRGGAAAAARTLYTDLAVTPAATKADVKAAYRAQLQRLRRDSGHLRTAQAREELEVPCGSVVMHNNSMVSAVLGCLCDTNVIVPGPT